MNINLNNKSTYTTSWPRYFPCPLYDIIKNLLKYNFLTDDNGIPMGAANKTSLDCGFDDCSKATKGAKLWASNLWVPTTCSLFLDSEEGSETLSEDSR